MEHVINNPVPVQFEGRKLISELGENLFDHNLSLGSVVIGRTCWSRSSRTTDRCGRTRGR